MSLDIGHVGLELGRLFLRPGEEADHPRLLDFVEQNFVDRRPQGVALEAPVCAVLEPRQQLARFLHEDATSVLAHDAQGVIHGACIMTRTDSPHPELTAAIVGREYWGIDLGPSMAALLMADRVWADYFTWPTFWAVSQKENMQVKIALRRNLGFTEDLNPPAEIKRRCAGKRNAAGAWVWRLDPQDLGPALRFALSLREKSTVARRTAIGAPASMIGLRITHPIVQDQKIRAQLTAQLSALPERASSMAAK